MKRKLLIALAGAMLLTGALAGGAYAYWTAHGSGSGTTSVGSPVQVTVQAVTTGTPSSKLMPGGSADLLVQLNNPNAYSVTIVGISQNGTVVDGSGCTGASSGVSVPTQAGLSISVASGTSVVHIPGGAAMSLGSASSCQGASFQIPVSLTVQR